ncbi:sensor histidine kinase [Helicobacter winghamensis]|uniref:sensor histidine kinase n=1 Tax=Helicobacter winghamensis TaxID=157268 RepID=UPI00351AD009
MQKLFLYICIALVAVFSTFFYACLHIVTYQNIESKLQQTIKQDPFNEKISQIQQDISQEVRNLETFGIVLVALNCSFWILIITLLWKEKQRLKTTIATLNTLSEPSAFKSLEKNPLEQALKGLLERIQEYYEIQKQLYSGIAHELKTPLAVIKAKCEVTLLKPRENVVYINALKENIQSVNVAQASIKALFDLQNCQIHKESPKKLVIQNELENITRDFALLHKDRKFDYKLQVQGLELAIQPSLLRQIIQNFLQNAFKFTPKDKAVSLKSYVENGILKIEVLDEGCGIATNFDVFAPFKKNGEQEGIGLGLFLAKRVAQALGGEIKLENRKDTQGAIATFTLKI